MVRYAEDFVILGRSLKTVHEWTRTIVPLRQP